MLLVYLCQINVPFYLPIRESHQPLLFVKYVWLVFLFVARFVWSYCKIAQVVSNLQMFIAEIMLS